MSNRPKHFENRATAHRHARKPARISSRTILKWVAVILVILLLFWLFIAEDIGAYVGWGNP